MIPDSNFITSLLNVSEADIQSCHVRTDGDEIFYDITLKRKPMACPYCGRQMIGHGHKLRKVNHPAVRTYHGTINYYANRYICKVCKKTCLEQSPFGYQGFNSSYFMLQTAMKRLGNLNYNLKMISDELNISPTQLNTYLDSFVTIPRRRLPENLGIDEIHSPTLARRNASYLCVLVDNDNSCIYDVLDSRGKFYLGDHFSKIPRHERYAVKYITIDMWEPYRDIANTYFPKALVAVDPFHVIEHLCKDFQNLRIELMRQCEYGSNAYYLLKNWHWLFEKDNVNLDNEEEYNHRFGTKLNRRDIFNMMKNTFPVLYEAYELKEAYRRFNKTCSYENAVAVFDQYVEAFKNSGIRQYDEFVGILEHWKTEILNSFLRTPANWRLSNSRTENINGKIRTYLDISRGIGNFDRFRKRVIFALNPKIYYALTSNLQSISRPGKRRGSYNKPID